MGNVYYFFLLLDAFLLLPVFYLRIREDREHLDNHPDSKCRRTCNHFFLSRFEIAIYIMATLAIGFNIAFGIGASIYILTRLKFLKRFAKFMAKPLVMKEGINSDGK